MPKKYVLSPPTHAEDSIDDRLIFLASQPRSGSTMLQRVLAGHPDVCTSAEPWLMLPLIYGFTRTGQRVSYNVDLGVRAVSEALAEAGLGQPALHRGMHAFATSVYGDFLRAYGRRYFLDKTPRYYLILDELQQVFPRARKVVLLRNPLAVLCSMVSTWGEAHYRLLSNHREDLFDAPTLLAAFLRKRHGSVIVQRYEALAARPHDEVERLCRDLGISYEPRMIEYGSAGLPEWKLGDPKVYARNKPEPASVDKWAADLARPQVWRFCREYLDRLDPSTLYALGFDWYELDRTLRNREPNRLSLIATVSLAECTEPASDPPDWIDSLRERAARGGVDSDFVRREGRNAASAILSQLRRLQRFEWSSRRQDRWYSGRAATRQTHGGEP